MAVRVTGPQNQAFQGKNIAGLIFVAIAFFGFQFSLHAKDYRFIPLDFAVFLPADIQRHDLDNATSSTSSHRNVLHSDFNATRLSLLHDLPHPLMICDKGSNRCCVPWHVDVDEWRTHHPDWRVVSQNQSHYCLAKYKEPKAAFFRELYRVQWLDEGHDEDDEDQSGPGSNISDIYQRTRLPPARRNCSNVLQNFQVGSGMGASISSVMNGFHEAFSKRRPYQLNKHREGYRWLYATDDNSSWAWCPTTDLNCFVLPVGNCMNKYGHDDKVARAEKSTTEYMWINEYLLRFRHATLWQIQNATQKLLDRSGDSSKTIDNCTVIHVRRGDAGLSRSPFRRYAGLSEYIKAGNIGHDELILILTDDQSTIYEAETFYPDYRWIYMERPRVNITYGGFDGHVPSGDPAHDFVIVYAESMAASRCNKMVYGQSGFVESLRSARNSLELDPPQTFYVATEISKSEASYYVTKKLGKHKRAEVMIEKIYREAAVALKNRTQARNII